MIPEQWVSEITSRFPYYSNKPEEEQSSLRSDLIDFASKQKDPSILDDLLNEFKGTEFKRAPGIWWFYQRVKLGPDDQHPAWRECEKGHKYSHKGNNCPVCESYKYKLHTGDVIPSEVVQVQDSCSHCSLFQESREQNGMPRLYGPMCNEFGTPAAMHEQMCKDCKCFKCCELTYLNDNDVEQYREKYGDIVIKRFTGTLELLVGHMEEKNKTAQERAQERLRNNNTTKRPDTP